MAMFVFSGRRYLALTMRADTALKRCKDLTYLSFFGGVSRDNEIVALLADVASECAITTNN